MQRPYCCVDWIMSVIYGYFFFPPTVFGACVLLLVLLFCFVGRGRIMQLMQGWLCSESTQNRTKLQAPRSHFARVRSWRALSVDR